MQGQPQFMGAIPTGPAQTQQMQFNQYSPNRQLPQYSQPQFQQSPQQFQQSPQPQQFQQSPQQQQYPYSQIKYSQPPFQPPFQPQYQPSQIYQQPNYIPYQPSRVVENITQPSVVKEIHHIERPLEVVTIEEIESPWRMKCATLERQILELQIQLRKGGLPTLETVEVVDDSKVKELEAKRNQLKDLLDERNQELDDLNARINDMRMQIEESTTTKMTWYTTEIETWQKRYNQLDIDNVEIQKKLKQISEELSALQAQKQPAQGQRSEVRTQSRVY